MKGTFLYRISKDTSFKREIDQAKFLTRIKRNEDIQSGMKADEIPCCQTDILLDIEIGVTREIETNKMNEKEALAKAIYNLGDPEKGMSKLQKA